jgi:hypothetical protein
LALNSIEGIVIAAVQDVGIAMIYAYQGAEHVADGSLEIVLSDRSEEHTSELQSH